MYMKLMPIPSPKPVSTFLSVLFLAVTIWIFGHEQLGGFDMSALVDTGWRIANSKVPYVDFPLTTPVAFYVGAAWVLQIFGVKWLSFVVAAIILTVAVFLAQIYLLSQIMDWKPALAISMVSQVLCSVVISYWWYNARTMNGGSILLKGVGTPRRSYLYAADLAVWLWTLLLRGEPCHPYNVSSVQTFSIDELAKLIQSQVNSKIKINIMGLATQGSASNWYMPSIARFRNELKLDVWIPADSAIARTINFAMDDE